MNIFTRVPTAKVPRSVFDVSSTLKTSGSEGYLYPVLIKNCMPGDVINLKLESYVKFMPMINPLFHDVYLKFRAFYCPHRLVDEDFEDSLTGGETEDVSYGTLDNLAPEKFPRWNPDALTSQAPKTSVCVSGKLWDYFGFPLLDSDTANCGSLTSSGTFSDDCMPLAYPLRSYNKIYNEWFRDEEKQSKVIENETDAGYNYSVLKVNWRKDYFTSASLQEQKGVAPAVALSGIGSIQFRNQYPDPFVNYLTDKTYSGIRGNNSDLYYSVSTDGSTSNQSQVVKASLDFSQAGTFSIKDLRLQNSIQKWMERNEECGSRYGEYLRSMYGVYPRDERLQRPEYIGGYSTPVSTSQVLATTAATGQPLGDAAGKAESVSTGQIPVYRCYEHGTFMVLMYVTPRTSYNSQGFPREWMYKSRYDWPNPLFCHLGNVPVSNGELYAKGVKAVGTTPGDDTIFGWQGKDDECRVGFDQATGDFRNPLSFGSWTFDRTFNDYPANNSSFIQCNPPNQNYAVPTSPHFAAYIGFNMKMVRPIPKFAIPML